MTMVSIPVSAGVRDELNRLADERGISVDAVIRERLASDRGFDRFVEMSKAMEMNPPDSAYFAELWNWQSEAWD